MGAIGADMTDPQRAVTGLRMTDERQARQQQPGEERGCPMLARTSRYQSKENHTKSDASDPDLSKACLTHHGEQVFRVSRSHHRPSHAGDGEPAPRSCAHKPEQCCAEYRRPPQTVY